MCTVAKLLPSHLNSGSTLFPLLHSNDIKLSLKSPCLRAPLSPPGATNVVIHKRRKLYENWVEPNMFLFAKGENFMKIGWCPKCFVKGKNLWKLGVKYWQSSFVAQNFALSYSSSSEATQTQGATSSTTSSGVTVVSHPLQGQCTSLRNIFNFVLHYIIPKLPALLLCFPSLMGGGDCMYRGEHILFSFFYRNLYGLCYQSSNGQ